MGDAEYRTHTWVRADARGGFVCAPPLGEQKALLACWGCGAFVADAQLVEHRFLDMVAYRLRSRPSLV